MRLIGALILFREVKVIRPPAKPLLEAFHTHNKLLAEGKRILFGFSIG
jgi:hypothetical protein